MKSEYIVRQLEYPGATVTPTVEWPVDTLILRAEQLLLRSWELHAQYPSDYDWPERFHAKLAKALINRAEAQLKARGILQ